MAFQTPHSSADYRHYIGNDSGQPGGFLEDSDTGLENLSYFFYTMSETSSVKVDPASRYEQELVNFMIANNPYWTFLLTELAESHSEGHSTSKSMSDCYTSLSTGGEPIMVSVSGHLYTTKKYDYMLDFMVLYDAFFRGTNQKLFGISMDMVCENTTFVFKPGDFSYTVGGATPDYTPFNINGLAHSYRVDGEVNL